MLVSGRVSIANKHKANVELVTLDPQISLVSPQASAAPTGQSAAAPPLIHRRKENVMWKELLGGSSQWM